MSVIEEMWKKNIFSKGDTAEKDKEIRKAMEMFTKNEGILEKSLTGDTLKAFHNIIKWQEELTELYEYLAFRDGFKAGIRLGVECDGAENFDFYN